MSDDKVRDALTHDQRLSLITAIHDVYRRTGPAIEPSSIDIVLAVEGAVVRMLATVRADAWDEGAEAGFNHCAGGNFDTTPHNPYRSEATP